MTMVDEKEAVRLRNVLAEQERRIAELERQISEFAVIESRLLRAISIANHRFREMVRSNR